MGKVYGWESLHFGKRAESHRVFICQDVITAARLNCADYPAMAVEADGMWEPGFNTYLYSGGKSEVWLLGDTYKWCQQIRDESFNYEPGLEAKFCIIANRNKTDINQIVKQCWELHGDDKKEDIPEPPAVRVTKLSSNHNVSRFDLRGAL